MIPRMRNGTRLTVGLAVVFHAVLLLTLASVLFQFLDSLLPKGLAKQVSHNTEAYFSAVVLVAWIQSVRPRLHGSRAEWPVTAAAAAVCLAVALVFYNATSWPTRFTTLNEALFALAVLIPIVQPRTRRPALTLGMAGALFAVTLVGSRNAFIVDMAETLAVLILAPLALDLFDRRVLTADAPVRRAPLACWIAFLIAMPLVLHMVTYQVGATGVLGEASRYGVRFYEAFILMLLLHAYFGVQHLLGGGRVGERVVRRRTAERSAA